MKTLSLLTLLLVLNTGQPLRAQQNVEASLFFGGALPQGSFKTNVGKNGFGITGNVGYAPTGSMFLIGLSLGYLIYGSESREEPFSGTIPDVMVDVKTDNQILLGHLLVRVQPNLGSFRPYLQAVAGLNYLFTTTRINSQQGDQEEIASSTDQSDAAFSYGGGGGVMLLVYSNEDAFEEGEEEVTPVEVLLDLGARYTYGARAKYLKEGSIQRTGGAVTYTTQESATDLAILELGVTVRF